MLEHLTEVEIDKIEAFCQDETLFEAVRKVVLAGIYHNGVLVKGKDFVAQNPAFNLLASMYEKGKPVSDEEIGQNLRGLYEGVHCAQSAFAQLQTIKRQRESVETPYNEAI